MCRREQARSTVHTIRATLHIEHVHYTRTTTKVCYVNTVLHGQQRAFVASICIALWALETRTKQNWTKYELIYIELSIFVQLRRAA